MMSSLVINFWIAQVITIASIYLTTFSLGLIVVKFNVKVNYTRKGVHFLMFFLPAVLISAFPHDTSVATFLLNSSVLISCMVLFIEPIRNRISFFAIAFASFDRPEDRPNTLFWGATQLVGIYVSVVFVILMLQPYERVALITVTSIVASIGDGLAEPIGVKFGKHKYKARGFFTEKTYYRSIEGSLCVFLTGIIAIIVLRNNFSALEFVLALAIIPLATTVAEAFSPHTWDNPFILLTGGASTIAVIELASVLA
mgnify:CR=1 FL=1